MLDAILDWVVIAAPAFAGLVAWLFPVATSTTKHRVWLFVMGVGFSALIILQQTRAREKSDVQQIQLRDMLNKSLQRHEYTKGQLDSISLMIGNLGEKTNNETIKLFAGAIAKMREERFGKIAVLTGATEITIVHGFTDPNVVVFPSATWMTSFQTARQDATSVTFIFSNPAPAGGIITWRASRMSS